jgi:hypothetical protein
LYKKRRAYSDPLKSDNKELVQASREKNSACGRMGRAMQNDPQILFCDPLGASPEGSSLSSSSKRSSSRRTASKDHTNRGWAKPLSILSGQKYKNGNYSKPRDPFRKKAALMAISTGCARSDGQTKRDHEHLAPVFKMYSHRFLAGTHAWFPSPNSSSTACKICSLICGRHS